MGRAGPAVNSSTPARYGLRAALRPQPRPRHGLGQLAEIFEAVRPQPRDRLAEVVRQLRVGDDARPDLGPGTSGCHQSVLSLVSGSASRPLSMAILTAPAVLSVASGLRSRNWRWINARRCSNSAVTRIAIGLPERTHVRSPPFLRKSV
jgi:hypothetical protein